MNKIENLKPFPKFCCSIGYIPTSYNVAMSYEEQLWWFCDFLENTVIPTVNQNGQSVEELQNLFVELKNYVDNYLENLDIQSEINNKLDEMAESGQLTDIIAQYLQLAGLLCYDNINAMKNATNLVNGSFARTYGYYEKNDGGTALYKIRNITTDDIIDNAFIISLNNNNTIIAELIPDKQLNVMCLGIREGLQYQNSNETIFNNLLKENTEYFFPDNKTFYLGNINLTKSDVKFYGNATIYVRFYKDDTNSVSRISFENLKMYGLTENSNIFELQYITRFNIKNCKFYNCNKAISYNSIDSAQNVSRGVIDNNYFYNVNYALYGERPQNATQLLIVADIHFTNNMIEACKIQHIHVEGFDGGIISNNTMFFLSYMQQPQDKTNNIYIDHCNWTIITDNNLFEAGTESILLKHAQAVRIANNNIAWSGQRVQSSAIKFTDGDVSNLHYNLSTIIGNHIQFASGHSIECTGGVGDITITGNILFANSSENAEHYYYGTGTYTRNMSSINCDDTTTNINIVGNLSPQNNFVNLSTNAVTNDNSKADGNFSNIRYIEQQVTVNTSSSGNTYANIAVNRPANTIIGIIPLYDSTGQNVIRWDYHTDNTIQIMVPPDSNPRERTYKFRIYYFNNAN